MILMEKPEDENSQHLIAPSNDAVHDQDNMASASINHGGTKLECEFAEEEVKGILEVIASTGRFWHDWYKLKSVLSFQLKQVLSEYPESKMTSEQQNASLGETYPELAKRLDEALLSFVEGPPFTLQRLCEILLEGKSIYPSLSKLALALEKPDEPEKASEETEGHTDSAQNGAEPVGGDKDEVMTDVEEADIDDEMTIDMEAFEEIVGEAEAKSEATASEATANS